MRIIIYTGKGGVGKTSIAAATAVKMAKQGKRTLILSTDAAHSLADAFGVALGPDPVQISEFLWGQEVNSLRECERNWGVVQAWLAKLMDKANLKDITTDEMIVFPGMEELFSLLQIKRHAESDQFDAIIVDCAPTGETLRLLSYPNVLEWWMEKIFPHERRLVKVLRPVAKVFSGYELPSEDVMDSIASLVNDMSEMQSLLLNPAMTSVRIVLNPEKMVISEAKRSFTYLNLFGFHTDAIIVNRILPEEASEGFWAQWHQLHRRYEEEITENFSPLPILRVPLMTSEVCGLEMLDRVGELLFEENDPMQIMYEGRTEEIRKVDDGYQLFVDIPFVDKQAIDLTQKGEELTLHVGSYKRKVILPRALMGSTVEGAKFSDGKLSVRFASNK